MRAGEARTVGRTGLKVTALGMGTAAMGGLYAAVSADASLAALKAAWQAGIRHFDIGDDDQGIVHVIGPELGLTLPGTTFLENPQDPLALVENPKAKTEEETAAAAAPAAGKKAAAPAKAAPAKAAPAKAPAKK